MPFTISMCSDTGVERLWEWEVDPFTRKVIVPIKDRAQIRAVIRDSSRIVMHNAKFDVRALATIDIEVPWEQIDDTLLQAHVLDPMEDHGLKPLGVKYLDINDNDQKELQAAIVKAHREAKRLGWSIGEAVMHDAWMPHQLNPKDKSNRKYAGLDARRTILLFLLFQRELEEQGLAHLYERERSLQPEVFKMEERGLSLNPGILNRVRKRISTRQQEYENKAIEIAHRTYRLPDLNIRSPKQMKSLLFDRCKFKPIKLGKDGPSTDADTLIDIWTRQLGNYANDDGGQREFVGKPTERSVLIDALLNGRKASTNVTYLNNYLKLKEVENGEHILHPSANQTGTRTTRFSMSNPNGQNADHDLREVFGPRDDHFWLDSDYSNLELRLSSYDADEKDLIHAFEHGISVHLLFAEALHGPVRLWGGSDYKETWQYKRTKNGNFAVGYGAGEARADATYGVDGAYRKIKARFTNLANYTERIISSARKDGFINTMFGYRIMTPKKAPYKAVNYRIQGTAGDVMKYAMLNCAKIKAAPMILTVHDELIFEVNRRYRRQPVPLMLRVKKAMEEPGTRIGIPTPVDISIVDKKWSEKRRIKLA